MENAARLPQLLRGERACENDGKRYAFTTFSTRLLLRPLIDNFNSGTDNLTFLSSTAARANIIQQLMTQAASVGLDGINLDFESITEEQAPHYIQFVRELSIACRNQGIVFSIDDPVPTYSKHYDRTEQGIVADYVIIMGYDEHYAGSTDAGSVSSLGFVKAGIEDTLKEVPAQKVINAIPFYL